MPKIIIIGATSGIGYEVARLCIEAGWSVGVAGRRVERLHKLQLAAPERVKIAKIDVTQTTAPADLLRLIDDIGGMDIYFHVSGIGKQNVTLDRDVELLTVKTNVTGFTDMIIAAYNYFAKTGGGHIAVVSSVAGTRGIGVAPSYSATKGFQNIYIDALAQQSRIRNLSISFTDIRPGFVDTDILDSNNHYPMMMPLPPVAKAIFKAIKSRKRRLVIDWRFRIIVFFWELIPSWMWERLPIKTKKVNG